MRCGAYHYVRLTIRSMTHERFQDQEEFFGKHDDDLLVVESQTEIQTLTRSRSK